MIVIVRIHPHRSRKETDLETVIMAIFQLQHGQLLLFDEALTNIPHHTLQLVYDHCVQSPFRRSLSDLRQSQTLGFR